MPVLKQWIKEHKFQFHLATFLVISLPAVGLYTAALSNQVYLQWALLGLVVLGNLATLLSD